MGRGIQLVSLLGLGLQRVVIPGVQLDVYPAITAGGHCLDSATQNQTVQVNAADTQYITVYNTPIGGAELIKVDAADKTKRLGGVTFEIRNRSRGTAPRSKVSL